MFTVRRCEIIARTGILDPKPLRKHQKHDLSKLVARGWSSTANEIRFHALDPDRAIDVL